LHLKPEKLIQTPFSNQMQVRLRCPIALAILIAATLPAAAAGSGPTQAQIRKALATAESSQNLWATVNICNTKRSPRVIGIRGQMPSLGFNASLAMKIDVDYLPAPKLGFKPSGLKKSISLGQARNSLVQGGARWKLMPHQGRLRGSVTFVWRLGRRLLGQVTRRTTARHHDADFGDPPRFSAAQCNMP
jgi:hypothetical protein